MMPTDLAPGSSCLTSLIWSATGFMSVVPVTLPPGASAKSTRPASTGSVTAVKSTGLSVTAWASDCADGVAMPRMRSSPEDAKLEAMFVAVAWSPEAFCTSRVRFSPSV